MIATNVICFVHMTVRVCVIEVIKKEEKEEGSKVQHSNERRSKEEVEEGEEELRSSGISRVGVEVSQRRTERSSNNRKERK